MNIDPHTGLLDLARFSPSPNHDARPLAERVELLVIHNISLPPGEFHGDCVEQLFTNTLDCTRHPYFEQLAELRVSSHLLLRRTGECIQFVPFHQRAWHAGVSCYQGRGNCNDFSIGIELEGTDDAPYTAAQYEALGRVAGVLLNTYPGLTPERVVGHSDIAPGRKTDPGAAFDWPRLRLMLDQHRRAAAAGVESDR